MNLESRQCKKCQKAFKVLTTSKQAYCSKVCQTGNYQEVFNPWKDQRNQLKEESFEPELEQKNDTGKTWNDLEVYRGKNIGKIQKKTEKEQKPNIKNTKTNITPEENFGIKKTKIEKTKDKGNIMQDTKKESGSLSEPQESKEIQRMDSQNLLETLSKVDQPSVSLIDDSSNYLHSVMKGVFHNQPDPSAKAYDPDRVKAVVSCADGIYKLQKLKLESIRVQKELHQYFKGQK